MAVFLSFHAHNASGSIKCSRKPGKQAATGQLRRPCVKHRPATVGAAAVGPGATGSPGDDAGQQGRPPSPAGQAVAPEVLEALQRVQEAVVEAEQTLEKLESLPSAREPTQWDALVAAAKPLLQALALAAAGILTHSFGRAAQVGGSLLLGLALGLAGYRRGSLAPSGALAAAAVGWGTLGSSFRAGLTLLTFFFTSSKLTQLGDEQKAVEEEHKAGGQRDWKQVVCNALVPTILSVLAARHTGAADVPLGVGASGRLVTGLLGGFLGYYACCCGDTWASELGQLSTEEPRLITTLRPVRKGTNGGVTLIGLAASLAGGLCMGLTFFLAAVVSPTGPGRAVALQQWRLVPLGLAAGLVGSIIDSILGATIQFTGYNLKTGKITGKPGPDVAPISGLPVLDNNLVNIVSASCTALLAALASTRLFV